ncbi:cytochrome P450 71A1-like [Quercus lobata]|uniref:Cytochrome P450 71A1 n=1 Tax=Quercus lobata TaxID=97700 RepID=A0A7N2MMM8_QUELO|nr:cytochrome P450 71A1-like [Quercus lobata]XP_030937819.1 cytochrome P450 71A1-like [Quercus lobata]
MSIKTPMAFLSWPKESFQPFLLFASIFIAVLLSFFMKLKSGKRKFNLPPNPPRLPIIGNLHQLGNMTHLSLQSLAKKFGPIIYLQLGQVPTVVVSSARLAKEVMKTHDLALSSRPKIFSAKHLLYNCTDVAFSPYGAYWRHIRKICILELLSASRVQSYSFVREEEVARLVCRVAQSYPSTTNLSKMLGLYANDVLCRAAFGRDFSGGEYDSHGFQKMLEEFQVLLGGFSIGDFFPSIELIHSLTGMKSRLQNTFQRFDKLFDQLLTEHENPKREKEEHKDLVDVLLDIQRNGYDEMPLTTDNIKAIILDMFAGGTDTTFIALDWGMTELIMNPKVMEKAQAEVRRIVGDGRVVLEGDLPQLHYMKAVIKEIYRLHPPAPVLLPRESMEEVNINGYNIPAKTRFFVNAWAIGRDPESWENPDVFEPERFMGSRSTVDFKGQHFELIPFGAGRRSCPAITFGTASIELALAQLLHSFDWELPPGVTAKDLDMTEAFGITMHRIANLIVIAKPHFPLDHNDNPKI